MEREQLAIGDKATFKHRSLIIWSFKSIWHRVVTIRSGSRREYI